MNDKPSLSDSTVALAYVILIGGFHVRLAYWLTSVDQTRGIIISLLVCVLPWIVMLATLLYDERIRRIP